MKEAAIKLSSLQLFLEEVEASSSLWVANLSALFIELSFHLLVLV